jgi:hypothetical protein
MLELTTEVHAKVTIATTPGARQMSPDKVVREKTRSLTDLPNIGKAAAADLRRLGFSTPEQIAGQDPHDMYERLCVLTGVRQDPCVLDVFTSVTDFLSGNPPRPWWDFSAIRKSQAGRP